MRQVVLGLAAALLIALPGAGSAKQQDAPAKPQVVKNDAGVEIVIPAASPVRFERFDDGGEAHFSGSFVLTGTFAYWCEIGDCGPDEQPLTQGDLMLTVIVDPAVARRLPHWRSWGTDPDWNEIQVEISGGEEKLVKAVVQPDKLKALLSGKVPHVQGRIAIVVDNFVAGLSCDNSPYYAADFVRFATAAETGQAKVDAPDSCP